MHLDTTMELAAIRQREITHGERRRTPGFRPRPSRRHLFGRHVRRTAGTGGG